jgi:ABC-type bacteriocin/lantibiotic exporter with double-glycine peptidase domain
MSLLAILVIDIVFIDIVLIVIVIIVIVLIVIVLIVIVIVLIVIVCREENIDKAFRERFPKYSVPPSSELNQDVRRNVQLMLQAHEVAKTNDQVSERGSKLVCQRVS